VQFEIRNAKLRDASSIASLIAYYSSNNLLLPRTAESVIEGIRNFIVADAGGEIIGCCAIAFFTEELAEIRSVAVDEKYRGKGVGKGLVAKAEEILKEEGIKDSFVLTYVEDFFSKIGYVKIDKSKFPQKIWRDCLSCPKIIQCDEIAMVKLLL